VDGVGVELCGDGAAFEDDELFVKLLLSFLKRISEIVMFVLSRGQVFGEWARETRQKYLYGGIGTRLYGYSWSLENNPIGKNTPTSRYLRSKRNGFPGLP